MTSWALEIRQGIRSVLLRRGAARAAAVLSAVGVGLLTAMFAIADPYTLRDLPYPKSDRLAVVRFLDDGVMIDAETPTLDELRAQHELFDAVAGIRPGLTLRVDGPEGATAIQVFQISEDFFQIVGVPAPPAVEWANGPDSAFVPALLTSEGRRRLPGEIGSIGSTVRTDQGALRIVGQLPEGFVIPSPRGPVRADVLTAMPPQPLAGVSPKDGRRFAADLLPVLARLAPTARAESVRERLSRPLPSGRRLDVRVESLRTSMLGGTRSLSWGALAAGFLVLLTCAANVGNLILVRAVYRTREIRTREALGASRSDIVRLWAVESVVLACVAFTGGLLITAVAVIAINHTIPEAFVTLGVPALTLRVTVFALAATLFVVAVGFVPIMASTIGGRGDRKLTSGSRATGRRWRLLFMALQCAMAMMLAIGAALLLRSYYALTTQETGFDRSSAVVTVSYPLNRSIGELSPTVTETIKRLSRVAGVRHVGATSGEVVSSGISSGAVAILGQRVTVDFANITPGFFDAAGMRVVGGRSLSDADADWHGIVVNQTFARTWFADGNALGQPVTRAGRQATIVGIVRDAFDKRLDRRPTPTIYASLEGRLFNLTYVISPGAAAVGDAQSVRRAIAGANAKGVSSEVQTIDARYDSTIRDRTFAALVLTLFGIASAAVCITGVAGLVGFIVNRRTSEISVRMTLGASSGHIRWLVARDTLAAASCGAAVGLGAGHGMSRGLEHLVYGIAPGDWVTTLAAAALLLAIVLIATLIPARRATRLDPAAALRVE